MAVPLPHLPDLPVAGYSTRKQRELTDAIMFFIRGLERNRLLLLNVVIAGQRLFRKRFKSAYRAVGADDEFADAVFGYLLLLAGPNPHEQVLIVENLVRQQAQSQYDKREKTRQDFAKLNQAIRMEMRRERAKGRHTVN